MSVYYSCAKNQFGEIYNGTDMPKRVVYVFYNHVNKAGVIFWYCDIYLLNCR